MDSIFSDGVVEKLQQYLDGPKERLLREVDRTIAVEISANQIFDAMESDYKLLQSRLGHAASEKEKAFVAARNAYLAYRHYLQTGEERSFGD